MIKLYASPGTMAAKLGKKWYQFWMRRANRTYPGRLFMRLASWTAPPDIEAVPLAYINKNGCGYITPGSDLYHKNLSMGKNIFIGDQVTIIQRRESGSITLGNNISIFKNSILDTGQNGSITMDDSSSIHHNSILKAYMSNIEIGKGVMIAANCALYSYNHDIGLDTPMRKQPITSKGGIVIGDEAWLGTGVIVLDGATIGSGAVIGAGSVVTGTIPDNAIAVGNPAKVVKFRE